MGARRWALLGCRGSSRLPRPPPPRPPPSSASSQSAASVAMHSRRSRRRAPGPLALPSRPQRGPPDGAANRPPTGPLGRSSACPSRTQLEKCASVSWNGSILFAHARDGNRRDSAARINKIKIYFGSFSRCPKFAFSRPVIDVSREVRSEKLSRSIITCDRLRLESLWRSFFNVLFIIYIDNYFVAFEINLADCTHISLLSTILLERQEESPIIFFFFQIL